MKCFQRLGSISFFVLVLRSLLPAFVGFIVFFFILVLKAAGLPSMIGPAQDGNMALANGINALLNWGLLGSFTLIVIGIVLAVILGAIDYFSYSYILDEHDLRIRRGIINIDESAIQFHHIEDVAIEQPIIYRLLGVCNLVIYTAATTGRDDADEAEGRLPAISVKLANEIRAEIMRRSNIQEVVATKSI